MKPGRIAAWVVAATAVPGLAACGVSSSSVSSSSVSSPGGSGSPGASTQGQSPAAGQAAGAPARSAGSGGLTPPGTHLAFGRAATVGWVPPSTDSGTGAHAGIKLRVTVESIQKGTMADFRNVDLNASERKSTPYYVQVRVTALGDTAPPKDSDPAITFQAIDDRGPQIPGRLAVSWANGWRVLNGRRYSPVGARGGAGDREVATLPPKAGLRADRLRAARPRDPGHGRGRAARRGRAVRPRVGRTALVPVHALRLVGGAPPSRCYRARASAPAAASRPRWASASRRVAGPGAPSVTSWRVAGSQLPSG